MGIGRPYIWGLSAFGQEGVERVLEILTEELTRTMRQMGTPSIRDITPARVSRVSGYFFRSISGRTADSRAEITGRVVVIDRQTRWS